MWKLSRPLPCPKGVEYLADGYEITVEDIERALEAARQSVQNGDVGVGRAVWATAGVRRS